LRDSGNAEEPFGAAVRMLARVDEHALEVELNMRAESIG
jgi:hypothetical protein